MTLVRTPRSQPLRSGLEERGGERRGGGQPKRKRGEGKLNRAPSFPRVFTGSAMLSLRNEWMANRTLFNFRSVLERNCRPPCPELKLIA